MDLEPKLHQPASNQPSIPGNPSGWPHEATHSSSNEEDRQSLLASWHDTRQSYTSISFLHTLFERQVAYQPEAVALVFEDQAWSYAFLNQSANLLARTLQGMGIGPGVLVALCLERSFELVVALLAILKAGGFYVPLDPGLPQQRLAFMLDDCAASLVLTQEDVRAQLPLTYPGRVITLGVDGQPSSSGELPASGGEVVLHPWQGHPLQAAYLFYTSGSTGRPKGVINTHQGIYNRLTWGQERYSLDTNDRVLQKTPYTFDVSVWEFFWPLLNGATLVLARPGGQRDSAYLVQVIAEQAITIVHFVPSMLSIFLEEPHINQCQTLRSVFCSGEALSYALQQRFFAAFDAELQNLYGPTEAAIEVTAWTCERDSSLKTVPIGHPVAQTHIVLLDQHGLLVPPGEIGEIYIGGISLARGYHRRPDLTAEYFVPHPFSPEPGARLYRTGDLARLLPDGSLEFLGRLDSQVKLRGQRIELHEIEIAIAAHPAIRACLVQVQDYGPNDQRLVAYLIAREGLKPISKELRTYLRQRLPEYMIPFAFTYIDAWPLLSNGKIDRRALPQAGRVALQEKGRVRL